MPSHALNHKLDHYSATARGQGSRGRSAAELAGYAAAAGASLAMAGGADAAIIYSGVQNITAQIDPAVQASGLFQNSDNAAFSVGGSQFAARAGMQAGFISVGTAKYIGVGAVQAAAGGAWFLGAAGDANGAFLSASGADIGPGGSFATDSAGRGRVNLAGGTGQNNTFGHFPLGVTGIAGIRLASGNYGWIRLKVEDLGLNQPFSTGLGGAPLGNGQNYPDKVTVIDWAYEDSGAAIHAGATESAVPEPASLALLAAGALGIGAFRRRKTQVQ